jgi:hypothetical protein
VPCAARAQRPVRHCFFFKKTSVTLSLPWRNVWRSQGVDEESLEPLHHMIVYREIDEHFIAVRTPIGDEETTRNLISLKTFEIERSSSFGARFDSCYDGGYLFLLNSHFVRMLDVVSGTFLHDMPKEPSLLDRYIIRVNSNYAVTAAVEGSGRKSKLSVYDLKCLKETGTVPSHLLLATIDLECGVLAMMMNETRIVCLSDENMYVVDLKPIDRLRCPESC